MVLFYHSIIRQFITLIGKQSMGLKKKKKNRQLMIDFLKLNYMIEISTI